MRICPWLVGIDNLRRQGQPSVLPPSLPREGLLFIIGVHPRSVDLVVPPGLEQVQDLLELASIRDASTTGPFRAKGHETQDDPVGGSLSNEGRHFLGWYGFELGLGVRAARKRQ